MHSAYQMRRISSPNVAAVLRGSDAKLREEYIVYSVHADHLGIGESVNGDSIYNRALNNASGVAGMIEVAGIFPFSRVMKNADFR